MSEWLDVPALGELAESIHSWLAELAGEYPVIESVERLGTERWFVRMRGETRDFTTVWFALGQRTLRFETYVIPAPVARAGEVYEHLLRANRRLVGVSYALGDPATAEGGVILCGSLADSAVSRAELDRVIGTMYAEVERSFRALLAMGHQRDRA